MIKKLARSIREYKLKSILAPIFVAIEVVMEVLIPTLMADLVDYGIYKGDMAYTVKLGLMLFLAALTSLLFGALAGRVASVASCGFAKNLRQDMYYNVQNFSFSNIDKFSTASIITRLTTDVTNVQMSYQMIIRIAIRSPLMLIFALSAAIKIDAKLSMIFLLTTPILVFGMLIVIKYAHPLFKKAFKLYDKLSNTVQENLYGIRVVKSFVREDFEVKKFKETSNDIFKSFSKAEKALNCVMPLMQFCIYGCVLAISWFGAKEIVFSGNNQNSGLSTGELISLLTYTMQILMSLMMLSMIFVMITMSRASAERIVEILDEKSDITSPENAKTEVKNGEIIFDNVSFSYAKDKNNLCLENINLTINSGETIGILGSTGSSKTTLVSLIPRLYDTTEGTVFVGGTDVRDYDLDTLRKDVAMVLQKNVLFSGSIKENLRWGNENATDEDIVRVCKLSQADEFIQSFPDKYDTHIEQGGTNVSGGQKQRLCIARALLAHPKILILDDSTSAVDTKTDALIQKAFNEEIPDTTKIIIAQRISSIENTDKNIVLDDGKISAIGTHEELLKTSSIYREVYDSQVKGGKENE